MNPDHAHFAEWDAAYVMGALSSADRRAFEAHLETCDECRHAIGDLAPTVGLLSRVPAARALSLAAGDEPEGPTIALRDGIASMARARARRRRRATWFSLAAAAVVLVVAAVAIPVTISSLDRPAPAFALEDVSGAPLVASVRLTDVAWGTKIDIDCRYTDAAAPGSGEGRPYALAIVGADGEVSTVSTWLALPGSTARLSAGTALDAASIRSVEIRTVTGGKVLMRYDLPDTPGG
ncbi:zf-HC2 domain-containing protein [uncultured Microbacterium sp.]|uniref:zf-HC2 domain-containing protein n=1 Tax=uncultured Microbacterium sp. TaxID=191216 RepID=UPI0035C9C3D6